MRLARKLADMIRRDSAPARCLRRDASTGHAFAQSALGDMYRKGRLVPQNHAEAVKWYRLAAEQGDSLAQFNFGAMYSSGRGVPKDLITAYMWFDLSVARGTQAGAGSCRTIARQRSPHQVEQARTLAVAWKAARAPREGAAP